MKVYDDAVIENGVSVIPDSVTIIGRSAFEGCAGLKSIQVPAKKTAYYKKRLPEKLHGLIVELPA